MHSSNTAPTLTAGATCTQVGFVKLKEKLQLAPDAMPPAVVATVRKPVLWYQCPEACRLHECASTARLAVSGVCAPVSPMIETVDPSGSGTLAVNETKMVLASPTKGLL